MVSQAELWNSLQKFVPPPKNLFILDVNCDMSDMIQSEIPKHNATSSKSHINSPCNNGINKKTIRKACMSIKWVLVNTSGTVV